MLPAGKRLYYGKESPDCFFYLLFTLVTLTLDAQTIELARKGSLGVRLEAMTETKDMAVHFNPELVRIVAGWMEATMREEHKKIRQKLGERATGCRIPPFRCPLMTKFPGQLYFYRGGKIT